MKTNAPGGLADVEFASEFTWDCTYVIRVGYKENSTHSPMTRSKPLTFAEFFRFHFHQPMSSSKFNYHNNSINNKRSELQTFLSFLYNVSNMPETMRCQYKVDIKFKH